MVVKIAIIKSGNIAKFLEKITYKSMSKFS